MDHQHQVVLALLQGGRGADELSRRGDRLGLRAAQLAEQNRPPAVAQDLELSLPQGARLDQLQPLRRLVGSRGNLLEGRRRRHPQSHHLRLRRRRRNAPLFRLLLRVLQRGVEGRHRHLCHLPHLRHLHRRRRPRPLRLLLRLPQRGVERSSLRARTSKPGLKRGAEGGLCIEGTAQLVAHGGELEAERVSVAQRRILRVEPLQLLLHAGDRVLCAAQLLREDLLLEGLHPAAGRLGAQPRVFDPQLGVVGREVLEPALLRLVARLRLLGVHLECAEELLARGRLLVRRTQLIGGVGVLVAQPFKL
mmetsp:Transcript_34927/g.106976  ORF Transcript_34927/g.106976 Transcript_34927/m.106976 type:complete len:306 (-) Transcript_34927:349-1266(-)